MSASAVIAAPGREGAEWLAAQARLLGLRLVNNAVDIGVRVECAAQVMEPLTEPLYEAKLFYETPTFGDEVRTFCMNPYGEVTCESYGDVVTVNGHSFAETRTDRTNFAVLVSQRFTEPFHEPITYGESVSRLANLLGDGILVQRLGDLNARAPLDARADRRGRGVARRCRPRRRGIWRPSCRTGTWWTSSSSCARWTTLVPGVAGPDTLLYGVEVKFYSSRLELDAGPDDARRGALRHRRRGGRHAGPRAVVRERRRRGACGRPPARRKVLRQVPAGD